MSGEKDHLYSSTDFKRKLFERLNGISSAFNVGYPINPKLCYEYPPLNATTLENIVTTLISCPKFYTQTLHLMNKMNLPCPLVSYVRRPRTTTTGSLSSFFDVSNTTSSLKNDPMQISSESEAESELEIEEEFKAKNRPGLESQPKKLKVKSFLKAGKQQQDSAQKRVSVNEAFERESQKSSPKLVTKKSQVSTSVYDRQVIPTNSDGFSKIIPIDRSVEDYAKIEEDKETVQSSEPKFISKSDLEQNRLKLVELKELPVYRRYERGEPNSRIYLKNLHKDVTDADLKFVYGRFIDWRDEGHVNSFDIRLMKEGRMKGQAFITFPNEETASEALTETNGYLLKDKPIIISFARSAKPK